MVRSAFRVPPTLIHHAVRRFQPTTFRRAARLPVTMTIRHAAADDLQPTWMCHRRRFLWRLSFLLTVTQVVVQFCVTKLQDQRRIVNDEDLSANWWGLRHQPRASAGPQSYSLTFSQFTRLGDIVGTDCAGAGNWMVDKIRRTSSSDTRVGPASCTVAGTSCILVQTPTAGVPACTAFVSAGDSCRRRGRCPRAQNERALAASFANVLFP